MTGSIRRTRDIVLIDPTGRFFEIEIRKLF